MKVRIEIQDVANPEELERKIREAADQHFKESEKKPEYTIAELAEMRLPDDTTIRSNVTNFRRVWRKNTLLNHEQWIETFGYKIGGLYVDEILGKWTIESTKGESHATE